MRRAGAISIAAVALATPLAIVAFTLYDGPAERSSTAPLATATSPTVTGSPTAPTSASPSVDPATPRPTASAGSSAPPVRPNPCLHQATHAFTPTRISIAQVTGSATVLSRPMDARGVPGTPPVTSTGKTQFAWVPNIAPGMSAGNVLLNAHTWPDGTALGNHLLAGLHEGGRIVVHGDGGAELCYRVTERREVDASAAAPEYFATDGPPQLAIVVCSGTRLGPGNWTKRTLWFASPQQ